MTSASTFSEQAAAQREQQSGAATHTAQVDWSSLPQRQPPLSDKCWLHREQPGAGQPYVIISQEALAQIQAHGQSNLSSELGGALLGQAYRHEDKVFVQVQAALPAVSPDHGPVHFTFDADSWTSLHADRAQRFPELDIIGWYHTHPGLGVFYSSDDVVVHSAAFTLPWHVGIVVDPVLNEIGIFGWINGQLAPFSGCYELLDKYTEAVMPWQVVRTAVWYDDSHETVPETPGAVYMPANPGPSLLGVTPRLGLVVGAFGILLSILLFFGWVLPLSNQARHLENLVLTMAGQSLIETNSAACTDSRLRILTPVTGSSFRSGATVSMIGTADHPDAARYQLQVRPEGTTADWTLVNERRWRARLSELGQWDTTDYQPGSYELRLAAVDRNKIPLAYAENCIINLQLLP